MTIDEERGKIGVLAKGKVVGRNERRCIKQIVVRVEVTNEAFFNRFCTELARLSSLLKYAPVGA